MITYSFPENRVRCHPKVWNFPAGEVGVRVQNHGRPQEVKEVLITASLTSSDEVMQLFMLTDALRRQFFNAKLSLVLGYIPYARQDRVCNVGDSLSIAVFARLINAQNYEQVTLIDPHSDVAPALFERTVVESQALVFENHFNALFNWENENRILVAPDAGAAKKAAVIAAGGKFSNVLYAVKNRNLATGEITELSLTGDVLGKDVVVVDDLADGGRTFTELAEVLKAKGAKSMKLIVTHGIFTKGPEVLTSCYDAVYTTNTYHQDRNGWVDGIHYSKII